MIPFELKNMKKHATCLVFILGTSDIQRLVVCEGGIANFSCTHHGDNKVIHVLSAMYGRKNATLCCGSLIFAACDTTCEANSSLLEARGYCKEQYCTIWASNNIFGDPCPRAPKYLDITYQCGFKKGMYG